MVQRIMYSYEPRLQPESTGALERYHRYHHSTGGTNFSGLHINCRTGVLSLDIVAAINKTSTFLLQDMRFVTFSSAHHTYYSVARISNK